MYTEEKYEDEEDLRERARRAVQDSRRRPFEASEPGLLLDEILQAADDEAGSVVESILRKLKDIVHRESNPSVSLHASPSADNNSDDVQGCSNIVYSQSSTSLWEAWSRLRIRMLFFHEC
jgi:hypothetical protein